MFSQNCEVTDPLDGFAASLQCSLARETGTTTILSNFVIFGSDQESSPPQTPISPQYVISIIIISSLFHLLKPTWFGW